jgi:hypothetical protein
MEFERKAKIELLAGLTTEEKCETPVKSDKSISDCSDSIGNKTTLKSSSCSSHDKNTVEETISPKREAENPCLHNEDFKRHKNEDTKTPPAPKPLVHEEMVFKSTPKNTEGLAVSGYVPRQPKEGFGYVLLRIVQSRTSEGFIHPLLDILKKNPANALLMTRAAFVGNACVPGHSDQVLRADPTKTRFYPAHCIGVQMKKDETPEECVQDFTNKLNTFAKHNHGNDYGQYRYPPNHYYHSVEDENLPWNNYLQNKSVCHFLRLYYPQATRQDIMEDDDVLIRFFGTIERGHQV